MDIYGYRKIVWKIYDVNPELGVLRSRNRDGFLIVVHSSLEFFENGWDMESIVPCEQKPFQIVKPWATGQECDGAW